MFLKIVSHGQTSSQPVHSSHQTRSTGSQLTNHSTISVTTRYVIIYEDHALIILLLIFGLIFAGVLSVLSSFIMSMMNPAKQNPKQ